MRVRGGRWPHATQWFQTMETRESYLGTRSDFHTHVHNLPPQIGHCIASNTPAQKQAAAAIDGRDGSWNLPLAPLAKESAEACPAALDNPLIDKLEAAFALCHCHDGILKSSRGGEAADLAYRCVASALIDGPQTLESGAIHGIDSNAAACLRYTRDRISVPRDMSFPAARQLRSHLNWLADLIDPRVAQPGSPISEHDRRDTDPAAFAVAGA
mmetsp:Transcript_5966/g.14273  ORF Transcript_5966/g.14273 Transcript_5966/m.14273 type:complete len:213 (-) Transcript_5966:109-747(-)